MDFGTSRLSSVITNRKIQNQTNQCLFLFQYKIFNESKGYLISRLSIMFNVINIDHILNDINKIKIKIGTHFDGNVTILPY